MWTFLEQKITEFIYELLKIEGFFRTGGFYHEFIYEANVHLLKGLERLFEI